MQQDPEIYFLAKPYVNRSSVLETHMGKPSLEFSDQNMNQGKGWLDVQVMLITYCISY